MSGTSHQSRPERKRGWEKKDVSACFSLSFFVSSGWAVFFGRGDRRKQKAAGEGEQLAAANPPFRTQTGDNGGHRSICFYLSFFVLFLPHCAAGRCFTFSSARSLGPLSSHLFRHLPGQQFLLCMSQTRREGEAESQREKKRRGNFFGPFYSLFFPSSPPFIHPPLPIHRCPPRNPHSTTPHPPSNLPPLTIHCLTFFPAPPVFSLIYFRDILTSLLVISLYAFFNFVPFPFSSPPLFFPPPSYASASFSGDP